MRILKSILGRSHLALVHRKRRSYPNDRLAAYLPRLYHNCAQSSFQIVRKGQQRKQRGAVSMTTKANENVLGITSSHYETHSKADSYENAYFYEPGAYMEHLVELVNNRLQLVSNEQGSQQSREGRNEQDRTRCILDIGGGTGNFAQALVQRTDGSSRFIVVDPFLDPTFSADADCETGGKDDLLSFIKAPAEDFLHPVSDGCWRKQIIECKFGGYDQILLKEVVHHFQKKDRVGIFRGMLEGLRNRSLSSSQKYPSLLIVTRPDIDIDYPLWDEARIVWRNNQPSVEEICSELREAGFNDILWSVEAYPCSISLERWQSMVKNRFWSTFSNFSDSELEDACDRIAQDHAAVRNDIGKTMSEKTVYFEDRLIFLTAS